MSIPGIDPPGTLVVVTKSGFVIQVQLVIVVQLPDDAGAEFDVFAVQGRTPTLAASFHIASRTDLLGTHDFYIRLDDLLAIGEGNGAAK